MNNRIRDNADNSAWGGCLGWGFFGIFAIAGLAASWFLAVLPMLQIFEAGSWQSADCKIESSRVETQQGSDSETYRIAITYTYEYGGEQYEGDRYNFSTGSSSGYDGKAEVVARYPPGSRTLCFVDPDQPSQSVINRSPGWFLLWGLFGLPFLLIGLGGLIAMYWGKKNAGRPKQRARRPGDTASKLRNALASTQGTSRASNTVGPGTGSFAPDTPKPGPMVLKPETQRTTRFIIFGVIALFWNGFLAFFFMPMMNSDETPWAMILFMTPFVLVGLGIIIAAAHQGLAIFNPQVELGLSDGDLRVGESYSLSWKLTGNADRLQQLSVFLEGREAATYSRGTTTTTDHSTFYKQALVDEQRLHFKDGRVLLSIPSGTLPTFQSFHNQIQWRLIVEGEIPWWPDIKETFPVWISPPQSMESSRL